MAQVHVPQTDVLEAGLTDMLNATRNGRGRVTVLDRRPNVETSSSPSEVVKCRLADGSELDLLCKYGAAPGPDRYGHRGGVPYEAEVYRRLVSPSGLSAPAFFGAHADEGAATWLVIEHLGRAWWLNKTPDPFAMPRAARWIGRFHHHCERRPAIEPDFLKRYDLAFYQGWARRTARFARPLRPAYPWLSTLCAGFVRAAGVLLAAPPAIIHGEYYPKNILAYRKEVYPVDWESAAVGPGEIDLASLTERWPREIVRRCERAYRRARWPKGAPGDHELTLVAARLYLHLRWLGDRPAWTTDPSLRWRFDEVRSLGEQLGLV